jgi:hypothetical protein
MRKKQKPNPRATSPRLKRIIPKPDRILAPFSELNTGEYEEIS